MNRSVNADLIVKAKTAKRLSWEDLAGSISRPVAWTVAALLGQHPLSDAEAKKIVELLELEQSQLTSLTEIPMRGSLPAPIPTDPTIYRFYEIVQVYGSTLKELINEKFGDGIMSAINFSLTVDKEENPSGDRVVVTMSGKFLPYEWKH